MNQRELATEIAYRILEKTNPDEPHLPPTPQEAAILAREFLKLADGYESKIRRSTVQTDGPVSLKWWK
jgi:hypothetical protein